MNRRILLALSALCLFAQGSSKKDISADELKSLLDKKVKLFFLDVREPKELEEFGTIAGYVNIPISQLESRIKEIPKDILIVSACLHGKRANRAADILNQNGYKQISCIGLEEYKNKGYKLVYPKVAAKP